MTGTGATGTETPDELSVSEIHDVLRNDRRRLVLERLRTAQDAETVSDLAEHVGGMEAGESPPPRNVRQSVYVSLHQTHLPKLDELGIVDYDPDGKTVELAANARELRVYLEAPTGTDGVPPAYYAGVGLLGAVALLGSAAGVPGLRTVGPTAVGIVLSAAVVAGGVYDLRLRG
jgi:predicted transcriptional regulator